MLRLKTSEKKSTALIKESRYFKYQSKWLLASNAICMLCLILVTTSFQKIKPAAEAALIVHFMAYVHGEPLQLNKNYQTPFGESFSISRFRFYVGEIAPLYTESAFSEHLSSYYLIDFSDSASTRIEIPAYAGGACNGIRFQLGVDSADQNQVAQTSVLNPTNGMFWTPNSGYLCFKIEGNSPLSSRPAHLISYYIGGYRFPFSTVWKIKINTINEEVFRITNENRIIVEVPLELDYFFDGPTPLHIKDIPACTAAGELARKLSENFIGSFTGLTVTKNP